MKDVEVVEIADPSLESPVLLEGLPGVGNVGKLVAEHLIDHFDSTPVRRIHSEHFPPQVTVEDGVAKLAAVEVQAVSLPERDLLVLVGDHQAAGETVGHYRLSEAFLDVAEGFDVEELLTIGGNPTGELVEEYAVVGAVTAEGAKERFSGVGVEFRDDEPAGGIVGASGLLLGLANRRDLPGACLMGETSGYIVDPKSARAVLEVLQELYAFSVDFTTLDERAEEMEEVVRELQQMQEQTGQQSAGSAPTDDDLRYIG